MGAFVALVAATNLVRTAPRAISVVIVGTLVALALTPVVAATERRFKLPRPAAVGVVVAGLVVVTAAAMALLAPPAINQGQRLSRDLDEIVLQVEDLPFFGDDLRKAGAADKMRTWIEDLPDRLKGADTRIGEAARRTVDGVLVAFLTLLVSISLLLDGDRLIRGVRRLVPPPHRPRADRIGRLAYDTVGRYVAGSLLVAGIAGLSVLVAGLVLARAANAAAGGVGGDLRPRPPDRRRRRRHPVRAARLHPGTGHRRDLRRVLHPLPAVREPHPEPAGRRPLGEAVAAGHHDRGAHRRLGRAGWWGRWWRCRWWRR